MPHLIVDYSENDNYLLKNIITERIVPYGSLCYNQPNMNSDQYYEQWDGINWSDDKEHFAEKMFIDLLSEHCPDKLTNLKPQVKIVYDKKNGRIDFLLDDKYPIEIDGESYHAEGKVSQYTFDELTSKQNEIIRKYGNITRITYRMIVNSPTDVVEMLNENITSFKKLDEVLQKELSALRSIRERNEHEKQEYLRRQEKEERAFAWRRKEFENELKKSNEILLHDIESAEEKLKKYHEETSKRKALDREHVKGIERAHRKSAIVGAMIAVAVFVGFAIYLFVQKKLEDDKLAIERASKITSGDICMTTAETSRYVGKTGVCVEYYVNYINSKDGLIWINDKKNGDFSAFVRSKNIMTDSEARMYENKTVEVHGDLIKYEYKDGKVIQEIIIESKDQIKIIE